MSCLNCRAKTRGPLRSGWKLSIGVARLPGRVLPQALPLGGRGAFGGFGDTAWAALRAMVGSLLMIASAPALVAALTSAGLSSVYGTTRRPRACASWIFSRLTGHSGDHQS